MRALWAFEMAMKRLAASGSGFLSCGSSKLEAGGTPKDNLQLDHCTQEGQPGSLQAAKRITASAPDGISAKAGGRRGGYPSRLLRAPPADKLEKAWLTDSHRQPLFGTQCDHLFTRSRWFRQNTTSLPFNTYCQ